MKQVFAAATSLNRMLKTNDENGDQEESKAPKNVSPVPNKTQKTNSLDANGVENLNAIGRSRYR